MRLFTFVSVLAVLCAAAGSSMAQTVPARGLDGDRFLPRSPSADWARRAMPPLVEPPQPPPARTPADRACERVEQNAIVESGADYMIRTEDRVERFDGANPLHVALLRRSMVPLVAEERGTTYAQASAAVDRLPLADIEARLRSAWRAPAELALAVLWSVNFAAGDYCELGHDAYAPIEGSLEGRVCVIQDGGSHSCWPRHGIRVYRFGRRDVYRMFPVLVAEILDRPLYGSLVPFGRAGANSDSAGDAFGYGGLGATGTGWGGGGTGEGNIGMGDIGSMGHGSGTGSGQGFGSGAGRGLRGRGTPGPSLAPAVPSH